MEIQILKEMFETRKYILTFERDDALRAVKPDKGLVQVYILHEPKLNVDMIKYYYSLLCANKIKHGILVYRESVTSSVKKILNTLDICVELFCVSDLRYNILKHRLVPRHTKIRREKQNQNKYPILKKTDPVVRFMGFETGDIIKIDRKDGTIYYRYVK